MSEIKYRMFPISLESDPAWLSLSLRYREFFRFIVSRCVHTESYIYKGHDLTYGQFVASERELSNMYNETIANKDDEIGKTLVDIILKKLEILGFWKLEKTGVAGQRKTIITIIHSDTYALIKNSDGARKRLNGARTGQETGHTSGQENKEENQADNASTIINSKIEKLDTGHKEKVLNSFGGASNTKQDQQDPTLCYKTQCSKDGDLSTKKQKQDCADASRRFKLTPDQNETFEWLISQKLGTYEATLCFWAIKHDLKYLKLVHKKSIKNKAKNVGSYMRKLIQENVSCREDQIDENYEFSMTMKVVYGWHELKITKRKISCYVGGVEKELDMTYSSNVFAREFSQMYQNYKGA